VIKRIGGPGMHGAGMFPLSAAVGIGQDAAINWWEAGGASGCVAAYNATGAASLAASYTDLSGSGNNAAPVVAPTWASGTGWIFNGSTQYLDTGIVPSSGYSMIAQITNSVVSGLRCIMGSSDTDDSRFYLFSTYSNLDGKVLYGSGNFQAVAPWLQNGNAAVAGQQGYRDGVADGGAIGAWGAANNQPIYVGARNSGAAAEFFSGNVTACAIYSGPLSAPEVSAVATEMAAL